MMWSLHHPQPAVAHEPAECCLQERASGNVIGVKNGNIFTTRTPQRVINVSRFGVRVVAASDVDRKSTRLNSSHDQISYAVFCLKKKKKYMPPPESYVCASTVPVNTL